jgi:hypothetical protein
MKTILSLVVIGLVCVTVAGAAGRPVAEIVDYGIYTGGQNQAIVETNAPAGLFLQGRGELKLERQTTKIPARLGTKFGFRFVVHGKKEDGDIQVHFVWLYPEITYKDTGKKSKRFEGDFHGSPEDRNAAIWWTFTEPSELVAGEWTFQVFLSNEKVLEKKFDVEKTDDK